MTHPSFFAQLATVTALTAGALYALFLSPKLAPYHLMGWVSLGGFVLLSVLMYFVAGSAARSKNKNDFTNTVLGFTTGKMMLAAAIIFTYLLLAEPADKLFVIPFFVVYFIFTAFETYFMIKLGKSTI
jgi:hypothetical protein